MKINETAPAPFVVRLRLEERSPATVEKHIREETAAGRSPATL